MDMTGCPTSKIIFTDERTKEDIASGKLWDFLLAMDREGNLMTCSTAGEDKWTETGGLPPGGPGMSLDLLFCLTFAQLNDWF